METLTSCWDAIVLVFKGIVFMWIILQLYLMAQDARYERKNKK